MKKFILLFLLLSTRAWAAEGFAECTGEKATAAASTVLLVGPEHLGSGVVVGVSGSRVTILTAAHVYDSLCGEDASCPGVQISQGQKLKFPSPRAMGQGIHAGEWSADERMSRGWEQNALVVDSRRSETSDLAVLIVDLKGVKLMPVKMPVTCQSLAKGDELFRIGYPAIGVRRQWTVRVDEPATLRLRCSSGQFIETVQESFLGFPVSDYYSDDVDGLPGSSGGPLFNARGELVGITSNGATKAFGPQQDVPCEAVQEFLAVRPRL